MRSSDKCTEREEYGKTKWNKDVNCDIGNQDTVNDSNIDSLFALIILNYI